METLRFAVLLITVGTTYGDKRLLLNDNDVLTQISDMAREIQLLKQQNAQLTGRLSTTESDLVAQKQRLRTTESKLAAQELKVPDAGSTYVRWGKSACSGTNTTMIYSGYTAGQHYNDFTSPYRFGGPANMLCLSNNPELSNITTDEASRLYGTEYEKNLLRPDAINEDVPCAVCESTNTHSSIMIPGRETCYSGWKKEYNGLIASDYFGNSASSYICLDKNTEYVPGGQKNEDGRRLYYTVTKCGALSCPPYKNYHVVNCVVCSK